MTLRYALMGDFANVTQDGKINVSGIFDRLFAPSFPAVHRQLFLVTCLETEPGDELNAHLIQVRLIDQDGKVLTSLEGQLQVGPGKQVVNQIHVFQDLRFDQPGNYEFNLSCDGNLVRTVGLELQELPPAQTIT